jgi:hypothetical protein
MSRPSSTLRALLSSVAALGCLTACGPFARRTVDDPAVWGVAPGQHLTATTVAFDAVVARAGCSSGKQGRPQRPIVRYAETTITITVRMRPHIDSGTCIGSAGVPYRIHLTQPLGHRTLVDGACIPPGTDGLETTSFCLGRGVRLTWRDGRPQPRPVQN